MRRSPIARAFVILWGLWFTAILAGVPALRGCPTGGKNTAAAAHAPHSMHAAHGSAAIAHLASGRSASGASSAVGAATGPECPCLACCCAGERALSMASVKAPDSPALILAASPGPLADEPAPIALRPHAFPFANAPPALRSALS